MGCKVVRAFVSYPSCPACLLRGTWCSGITSAPHAEGPGLKSQCVHWRVRSAAAAAVGYRERCCIHASCYLTTPNVSAASSGVLSAPHPRTGQGPQLISPREMQQLIWEQRMPAAARRSACAVLLSTGVSPHLRSVTHGLYSSWSLCAVLFLSSLTAHGAHGVVVSHPLRMRKALGSNPSVPIGA